MTRETKKLQTTVTFVEDGFSGRFVAKGTWREQGHDCRIAHEQREVIRELHRAINALTMWAEHESSEPTGTAWTQAHKAMVHAAPFLED